LSDLELRRAIYRSFAEKGRAPADLDPETLQRLAGQHAVVLDEAGRIVFSNPFSSRPTGYRAVVRGRSRDATCAWDAFGVVAALGAEGKVVSPVGDFDVPGPSGAVAHFLVPAARWYDDLAFT
jgi:hypothetical protein